MDNKATFRVGDTITLVTSGYGYGCSRTLRLVTRVLKQYVVLDDGTRWKTDGRPHPRRSGYQQPSIRLTTDEDRAFIERWNLEALIEGLCRSPYGEEDRPVKKLTLDQLRRIAAIVKELSGTERA